MSEMIKRFGRELRRFLNKRDTFEILEDGDWGAGGCWVLADALVKWLGPPAKLVAIEERRHFSEPGNGYTFHLVPVSHVAVKYDDIYIDYNGAQDKEGFLESLRSEGYENPKIIPWSKRLERLAWKSGLICDTWKVKRLLSKLNERFSG